MCIRQKRLAVSFFIAWCGGIAIGGFVGAICTKYSWEFPIVVLCCAAALGLIAGCVCLEALNVRKKNAQVEYRMQGEGLGKGFSQKTRDVINKTFDKASETFKAADEMFESARKDMKE